jgi:AcrR family transcriptional regulator
VAPAPTTSLGRGARGRILAAARRRFAAQGINATGIAELVAEAHVSRRTLYQQFASKDELIVAYLRELVADPSMLPQRVLDRDDLTPRARLLELFAALGEAPGPPRGDPFLAAAVELADPAHPARRLIAQRQAAFAERLADLAHGAGARDAQAVAERLLVLYCGAASAMLAADDAAPVAAATALARSVLEAATEG